MRRCYYCGVDCLPGDCPERDRCVECGEAYEDGRCVDCGAYQPAPDDDL